MMGSRMAKSGRSQGFEVCKESMSTTKLGVGNGKYLAYIYELCDIIITREEDYPHRGRSWKGQTIKNGQGKRGAEKIPQIHGQTKIKSPKGLDNCRGKRVLGRSGKDWRKTHILRTVAG